jgi:gamma-glutamyltranspeptidase/glutathione hydrolase
MSGTPDNRSTSTANSEEHFGPMPASERSKSVAARMLRRWVGVLAALFWAGGALADDSVVGTHGMVVSSHRIASEVGGDILRRGGNAIDAAVAVGYALAVVYPVAGNIGGGGFMTLRLTNGQETFLDFRERAPLRATAGMYLDAKGEVVPGLSTEGYLSVGVPGTVMGLEVARRKWGTMSRQALIAPAIRLAEDGYALTQGDQDIVDAADLLRAHPDLAMHFLKPDGTSFGPGDRLVEPDLAASLRQIARRGPDAFYRGPIADAIVAASAAHGGILAKADFEGYRVRELAPVDCSYRGFRIESAPPPSSGGIALCEILNILEGYRLGAAPFHSTEEVHELTEAMRLAYADRNDALGDPDFITNPVARLLDKHYADQLRARIDPSRATPSKPQSATGHEGQNTTHYSIVDAAGNAVSVTYTLNDRFGAKVIAGNTGIVLNDEMDDFTSKVGVPNQFGLVQGAANAIAPGKTPLSSMAPTIVTHDGRAVLVIGSPGGPRIISTVMQVIVDTVDHGMTIADAIAAPRIHHQWLPDILFAEEDALTPDVSGSLRKEGYTVQAHGQWSQAEGIIVGGPDLRSAVASAQARQLHPILYGASDPRGSIGAAVGY